MPHANNLPRYELHPVTSELTPKVLSLCSEASDAATFLSEALPELAEQVGARWLAVVRAGRGKWRELASVGQRQSLPLDLLAEVLDSDAAAELGSWAAAPLDETRLPGDVFLMYGSNRDVGNLATTADALAGLLGTALAIVRGRQQDSRRLKRLEAILDVAADWQNTPDTHSLLEKMAVASTRLLAAERASIFLWDRPAKTLVGRPALGVENGELRIPDNAGVVGQVVQTGESRRVDDDEGSNQIDRRVDEKLKFHTRSLLCVPLHGPKGEIFGAFEVINKRRGNFTDEDQAALIELASHAAIALQNTQQREQLLRTRNQLADQAAKGIELIGESPVIEALRSTVQRVAKTELAVLILGENGTGKEVVAQSIHYLSKRWTEPFVAVNCAALTETLLESELFGHEKGAFTDAREMRPGKFELASGGTLFLDEIGDMSLGGQSKLLRVLEEKVVVRVGGSMPIRTDSRVIAATNQDLAQLVRARRFREDLYFRLNVVTMELPPLRDRGDDVLLLADHFLNTFCRQAKRKPMRFTAAARKRLVGHTWPGNVRELRNLMERLAYLAPNDTIDAPDLSFILSPAGESSDMLDMNLPLTEATHEFQTRYITQHIERARGNVSEAARRLGLHRTNLYRKMRQLGMNANDGDER